jgi:hypothetical protein
MVSRSIVTLCPTLGLSRAGRGSAADAGGSQLRGWREALYGVVQAAPLAPRPMVLHGQRPWGTRRFFKNTFWYPCGYPSIIPKTSYPSRW